MKSPLRQIRERKGQTIVEVSRAVSIDPGNLSRVENGKQKASTELAEKLAQHFGNEISEMEILYPDRFMLSTADVSGASRNQ
jgi:transcriptional regulator with XRE-family HTH domain